MEDGTIRQTAAGGHPEKNLRNCEWGGCLQLRWMGLGNTVYRNLDNLIYSLQVRRSRSGTRRGAAQEPTSLRTWAMTSQDEVSGSS